MADNGSQSNLNDPMDQSIHAEASAPSAHEDTASPAHDGFVWAFSFTFIKSGQTSFAAFFSLER